jgi:hypothetical protein
MEKLTFTRACLSGIRVITVIMRAPLINLLCQTVMGWILALEYLLSGTRGAMVMSCRALIVNAAAF